jgi:hypothetical protein
VDERQGHARGLLALRIDSVRYLTLDYNQLNRANGNGPRRVIAAAEWSEPPWRFSSFDSVDFAVELFTTCNRVFSVVWDPPGVHEGLGLREGPAIGTAIRPDINVAVWDVSHASRWETFVGEPVTDVALHYRPWEPEGFWCPRISISCGDCTVELCLGEGHHDDQALRRSGDNIAVVFSPVELPDWARD